MSRKQARPPLLLRVWAELGAGGIIEDPTLTSDIKGERLDGMQMGRHVWINPIWNTVDTIVHELLHKLHPDWSERYVRNRTGFLMRRMTDQEVQEFYDIYQRVARKRRKRERKRGGDGGVHKRSQEQRGATTIRPDSSPGVGAGSDTDGGRRAGARGEQLSEGPE